MNGLKVVWLSSAVFCLGVSSTFARVELGAPFSDGMVLQRGMKVPVWGRHEAGPHAPGREVTVAFGGQEKTAVVDDATGCWRIELDPLEASSEPRTMTVSVRTGGWLFGRTEQVEVKDVLVGEVWMASGQSNMECPIWSRDGRYRDGKGGLMTRMTNLPEVRFVKTPCVWSATPTPLRAIWRTFEPQNFRSANPLSAVAFYYARELHLALGVPIGVVDCSWGGTNIDAWTPRCGYEGCPPELRSTAEFRIRSDFDEKRDAKGIWRMARDQPTVLWNGMVDAYAPMAVRGMIWYQGCFNSAAAEAPLYCAKMHALYKGWSTAFANPDMRLYFVQLAPYDQNWNALVAQQDSFAAEERNAAIVVTADVGNFDDIHPNDKEVVAKRLAAQALVRDYGFAGFDPDSPKFRSMKVIGDRAILSFDHAASWYVYAPDRSLTPPFELAGTNGVWHAATIQNQQDARRLGPFEGRDIVLKSEGVSQPAHVRYMGRARTAGTLYNECSLPLGPFEAAVEEKASMAE